MMKEYYKYLPGDRKDGWRLRNIPVFFRVIPFVMRTRLDSQNLYEEPINVEPIMAFIREHKEDIPNLSVMDVFIAGIVRMISQRPCINRFVVHNVVYAHNSIEISIAIKRKLSDDGEETMIKPSFDPKDTIIDVKRRMTEAIESGLSTTEDTGTGIDKVAQKLSKLPDWVFRMAMSLIFWADNHNLLPSKLIMASPWHCSAMFTNVGSIGITPIYHHLTELGTYSMFFAMGKREHNITADDDGEVAQIKTVGLKTVNDERICDGYYYAASIRYLRKILRHPEVLLEPPKQVVLDPSISNPLINDPNK